MLRIRAAAGVLASFGLAAAMVVPVHAEPVPPTLTIETTVSHYLGGWWEQQVSFNVTCDGFGTQEVWVDLPGSSGDILPQIGPAPEGTHCWLEFASWPDPGDMAGWNDPSIVPGDHVWLQAGDNTISVAMERIWAAEWPPEADRGIEHDMALTIDRVYLNSRGGIEVEGTSWCPEAADLPAGGDEQVLIANARWEALQYVGRRTALTATYDSGIGHPCWDGTEPDHGPYAWQTRYPYPDGGIMFVYSKNGKFGSSSMHLEAWSETATRIIEQDFAPEGWTSFEGDFVPYAAGCEDNNGDGWCVVEHFWYGFEPADLKPLKVR